jgi:phosphate transport system substrate-binding protein
MASGQLPLPQVTRCGAVRACRPKRVSSAVPEIVYKELGGHAFSAGRATGISVLTGAWILQHQPPQPFFQEGQEMSPRLSRRVAAVALASLLAGIATPQFAAEQPPAPIYSGEHCPDPVATPSTPQAGRPGPAALDSATAPGVALPPASMQSSVPSSKPQTGRPWPAALDSVPSSKLASASVQSISDLRNVTGAGEHFTWVLLDQVRPHLERKFGINLNLVGRESMLGHGCNQGIKKAKENRLGNETFGFVCCPLSKEEIAKEGLTVYPVALEPLLIIVNQSNPVTDIPIGKVRAIFRGEIRNWKEVGGEDRPIVLVLRPHCPQRPGHWKTIVPSVEQFRKDRIDVKAEAEVVQGVSDFAQGIGNIGATWIFEERHKVKVVTVSGIAATAENLKAGKYPFFQEQSIVTHGTVSPALAGMIREVQHGAAFREVARKYELLPLNALR